MQVSRCDESRAIKRLNLETFAHLEVPAVRQGNNFTYRMNAKEIEIDLRTAVCRYSSDPPVGRARDFWSLSGKQCDQMCSYIFY